MYSGAWVWVNAGSSQNTRDGGVIVFQVPQCDTRSFEKDTKGNIIKEAMVRRNKTQGEDILAQNISHRLAIILVPLSDGLLSL